ncbi:MAG: hypothetical protein IJ849_10175 [Selenomonadaceae bacterium]|nr:hypothetical protein [Selenomonadaceae bacterium]
MLYLNTRNTLPMYGYRNRLATLDSHVIKPEAHRDYQAPRSNMGVTSPHMEVDTYPSRHAYGYTNHEDFARQYGQQGKSDIAATASRHTQGAWAMINNAAKRGHNEIQSQAKSRLAQEVKKQRYIEVQAIPDPIMKVYPGELVGDIDIGHDNWSVDVSHTAAVTFNPGHLEQYTMVAGDIHSWVSEGGYDIYA